ncbi:MAG: hypothetical protein JO291_09765, partial [Acidimicrobiia bacterium]|nr:hypothetical protein [Acidimicrobiia bacterium]
MVGRLDRTVLTGIGVYRGVALAWLVIVLVGSREDLAHPVVAVLLVAGAALLTITLSVILWLDARRLLTAPLVLAELLYGFALLSLDGWVYEGSHPLSLGAAWPLAGVLTAGIAAGTVAGCIAGVGMGLGRVVATKLGAGGTASAFSLISSCVLYA